MFAPALGEARLLYGRDTFGHDYIMHLYGWDRILTDGEWPLWCPELFCGLPFIGSFALCPFYPSQWLYLLLPFNTSFTLQYALALALGGLAMAWWMRRLGAGRMAAVWGGMAFMASGHFLTLTHAGHLQKMIAIAWAPVALGAFVRNSPVSRRDAPGCILAAGVALAMQLLASHPQIFYATALACGAWLLMAGPVRALPKRLGLLVLVVALAVALAAIQFFPGFEMARVSNRSGGVAFAEAVETSYPPRELLEYVIPSIFGDSLEGSPVPYFGHWGERIVSDFVGAPLVLLALFGLVAGGAARRGRGFLAGMLLLSLLIGLGRYTPLYGWLYAAFPGWKSYRSPGTFMFLADLALIAFATLGVDRLLRPGTWVPMAASRWLLPIIMISLTIGGLTLAAAAWLKTGGFEFETQSEHLRRQMHLMRNMLLLGLEVALGAGLLAAALRWRRRWMVVAVAAAALSVSAFHNARYIRFVPLPPFLQYLHHPVYTAARRAAPWPKGPVRILEDNALRTAGMLSRVGTPLGYHPIMLKRYEQFVGSMNPAGKEFGELLGIWLARTSQPEPPASSDAITKPWELLGRYGAQPPAFLWKRAEEIPPYGRFENGADGEITLANWSPHRITLQVTNGESTSPLLILPEVSAPGWSAATTQGERLPVRTAHTALRAVRIPNGSRVVTLAYTPFSFRLGAFLTLLTCGTAFAALGANYAAGRRGAAKTEE